MEQQRYCHSYSGLNNRSCYRCCDGNGDYYLCRHSRCRLRRQQGYYDCDRECVTIHHCRQWRYHLYGLIYYPIGKWRYYLYMVASYKLICNNGRKHHRIAYHYRYLYCNRYGRERMYGRCYTSGFRKHIAHHIGRSKCNDMHRLICNINRNGWSYLYMVARNRLVSNYRSKCNSIAHYYCNLHHYRHRCQWLREYRYKNGISKSIAHNISRCWGNNMLRQLNYDDCIRWQHLYMVSGYKLIGNNRRICNRFANNDSNIYCDGHKRKWMFEHCYKDSKCKCYTNNHGRCGCNDLQEFVNNAFCQRWHYLYMDAEHGIICHNRGKRNCNAHNYRNIHSDRNHQWL